MIGRSGRFIRSAPVARNEEALSMAVKPGFVVVLFLAAVCVGSPVHAVDEITGEWELTIDFGGQELFATLSISRNDEGTYAGRWGINEVSDFVFDGETLTFTRAASFGGADFTMTFNGVLNEGTLEGRVSNEQVGFPVRGVRLDPRCPALGRWDIRFLIREQERSARLSVTQKADGTLDADWDTESGEHTVTGVRFEEGQLTVERQVNVPELEEFNVNYVARVEGDRLMGTLVSDLGEVTANGTRIGTELIGTWELTATSDGRSRTRILTVYPDLTGRYDFLLAELPVDVNLDGEQVTFHGEVGVDDDTLEIDFTGTLDGEMLTGELNSPRGVSRISGKKLKQE